MRILNKSVNYLPPPQLLHLTSFPTSEVARFQSHHLPTGSQTISLEILPFITTKINHFITSGLCLLTNNVQDPNQSGLTASHSTETACYAVHRDLSEVFDTVNHKTFPILMSLGIHGLTVVGTGLSAAHCSYPQY